MTHVLASAAFAPRERSCRSKVQSNLAPGPLLPRVRHSLSAFSLRGGEAGLRCRTASGYRGRRISRQYHLHTVSAYQSLSPLPLGVWKFPSDTVFIFTQKRAGQRSGGSDGSRSGNLRSSSPPHLPSESSEHPSHLRTSPGKAQAPLGEYSQTFDTWKQSRPP